jgi:hypothetical protein
MARSKKKRAVFCDHRAAKEHARFSADFAVTAKEPQWQCALKSTLSFEPVLVLLDSPGRYHVYYDRQQTDKILRSPFQESLRAILLSTEKIFFATSRTGSIFN